MIFSGSVFFTTTAIAQETEHDPIPIPEPKENKTAPVVMHTNITAAEIPPPPVTEYEVKLPTEEEKTIHYTPEPVAETPARKEGK